MSAETLMNIIHMLKVNKNNSKIILIICENIEHLQSEFKDDISINSQYITKINKNTYTIQFKNGYTFIYITKNSNRFDGYKICSYQIRTNSIVEELFKTIRELRNEIFELKTKKIRK